MKSNLHLEIQSYVVKALKGAVALCFMSGLQTYAMDSADVLPKGIYSPQIRYGIVSGIGQEYSSNGTLQSLGDVHTMAFDANKLISIQPQVSQLVSALNQFGSQNLGDKINLGYLKFNIQPEINYYAPVLARGITDHWTMAIGVPIVHYKNSIGLESTGSNIDAIHSQVGYSSATLNDAFSRLKVNLVTEAQTTLASLGYKPLGNTDTTFMGDVQIVSLYQFYHDDHFKILSKTLLGLPTGPEADPNDLAALDISGQTSIEQQVVVNYRLFRPMILAAKVFYHYSFADKVDRRVPLNDADTLPAQDQTEKVDRKIGDSGGVAVSTTYELTRRFAASAGMEFQTKAADRYGGSKPYDYTALSSETNEISQLAKLGIAYSTVQSYFTQEALLPFIVSIEYSDIIGGVNTPRITTSEIWLTGFF